MYEIEIDTVSSEDSSGDDDPTFFDQNGLNDLIRNLNLPKDASKLLTSRLKERNLLLRGTKITAYRKSFYKR